MEQDEIAGEHVLNAAGSNYLHALGMAVSGKPEVAISYDTNGNPGKAVITLTWDLA